MILASISKLTRHRYFRRGINAVVWIQISAVTSGPDLACARINKYLFGLNAFCAEKLHLFLFTVLERQRRGMCVDVIFVKLLRLDRDVGAGYDYSLCRSLDRYAWLRPRVHFRHHPCDEFHSRILKALAGFVVDCHPAQ